MLSTTSPPKRSRHFATQRSFCAVPTDWKYAADVMWPSASAAPICCTSASQVVRLPIGMRLGSSFASRQARYSSAVPSPTTVEKMKSGASCLMRLTMALKSSQEASSGR
jgi:hypothetical protein